MLKQRSAVIILKFRYNLVAVNMISVVKRKQI